MSDINQVHTAAARRKKIQLNVEMARLRASYDKEPGKTFWRALMQYALMIYEPAEAFANRSPARDDDPYVAAWRTYYQTLVEAGVYVGGDPLHLPETATTVRQKDGKRHIQDGPYANTKEQLGGFIILELSSLDEALDWAARCPATAVGAVEVRPLAPDTKARITE